MCAPRLGRGEGSGRVRTPWGRRAPARAAGTVVMATGRLPPRGREPRIVSAGKSKSASRRTQRVDFGNVLASVQTSTTVTAAPRRGAREPGSRLWVTVVRTWSSHSSGSRGPASSSVAKLAGGKQGPDRERLRTGARAQGGSLRSPPGRRRPLWFILQICGKRGVRVGIRDIPEPVTRAPSK